MTYIFSNNAATALATAIDDVVTQLIVLDASLFPSSATPTTPFKVTLQDVDTGEIEICDCTDVSGNVLTVIRGRENTTSISFPIGAIVHHRLTAENLSNFVQDLVNVGTGEGEVAHSRVGPEARFKTLQAGSNVTIDNNTSEVRINATDTADAANIGAGEGEVFKDKTGDSTLNLRTLKQGPNVTITMPGDDTITITSSDTASGANLGSTPGNQGIYVDSTGTQLNLKSLVAGTGIDLTADGQEITIESTGGGVPRNISTGLYTGGAVTKSVTPGFVDIAVGTGVIVDAMTDPAVPVHTDVSWGAQSIDVVTQFGPDSEATVLIDNTGTVQLDRGGLQHSIPYSGSDARDNIILASVTAVGGVITSIVPYSYAVNLSHHTFYDFYAASGGAFLPAPHNEQFLIPLNNRQVKFHGENISTFFVLNGSGRGNHAYLISGHPGSGEVTLWQMFDRGGTFYDTPNLQIDVAQYSPAGTRIPIPGPATAASIVMLYHAPGVGVFAEYAYDYYDTLDDACKDLAEYNRQYLSGRYDPVDNWLLLGALVVRKDATDFSDTDQARLYPFERNNFKSPFFVKSISSLFADPSPTLGTDLQTNDYDIIIQDASGEEMGRLAYVSTEDAVALGRIADPTQGFDPTSDGAIFLKPGQVDITGAVTEILNLSGQGTQQVYVSNDGALYGVEPPTTGWEESATSTFDYDFTNGNTTGAWVEVTGLTINPTADVDVGDRVDVYTSLYVENIEDKPGTIEIGVGINGADPVSVGASKNVAPESISLIPIAWTTTTHGGLVTTDTFTIYARRGASTDDAHLYLQGSTREHEYIVSVPSSAGGGGGNTDLGNVPAPASVTITSSTGSNTVIAGAISGTAGVMTGAQVDSLATKIEATDVTYENLDANNDVGPGVGQLEPGLSLPAQDGHILSSTVAGVRTWIAAPAGNTDLGNTPTATTVTITSSTGNDTILPAATTGPNGAGVMTEAQVTSLASKVDTGSSLGSGQGTVFSAKVGTDLQFKSLRQGSNVTITEDANEITINSSGAGGGIPEPADALFGYLREGIGSTQWVRGSRVFEQATPPSTPSIGDVWIDTT